MQPTLKESFVSRAATLADLEAIVELCNAYSEAVFGKPKFTIGHMRNWLTAPGFDVETSTRLVLSPVGQIVGCITVSDFASPPVHPEAWGCVHPDFERQGIGAYLIEWAEERARRAIARVPDGVRVAMRIGASSTHEPTKHLFAKMGLKIIRYGWLMVIDLDEAPPKPKWPAGLVVRTYWGHSDLRAVYRAANEAFQDHWGHLERQEEEGVKQWQHQIESYEEFDPSLWFLAMDGDQVAAVALCRPRAFDDPAEGFVNVLGVRRPWRRQGLALALLHHAFGEFYRRGKKRVILGVDASNLTGATRLYEKAGMYVARQTATYEKELRPGEELGTQSVEGEQA